MRQVILGLLLLVLAAPALAADREAAKISYTQGNDLFDQHRFADAAEAYGRAIEQDPQFLEAYYNRALADEMVDRQKAIADWHRFADVAANSPDFKNEVGQANARIQILGMLPDYPDALLPARYVPSAADYYLDIAESSESREMEHISHQGFDWECARRRLGARSAGGVQNMEAGCSPWN